MSATEAQLGLEFELELELALESELEFEFAFALEFGLEELTFGPISIPTGVQFALRHTLERSPEPPQSPTGECAPRHPGETPKRITLMN